MRAKEMNFATLPCLRRVAISHPEGNLSSLMCLEEHCELLQLACPFLCQEPKREWIDRCMQRSGFLFTHLPTFFCFLLLFSPVPLERDGPSVFRLKLLLVRVRSISFFIGLEVNRSPLVCKSAGGFTCQGGWFCFLGV